MHGITKHDKLFYCANEKRASAIDNILELSFFFCTVALALDPTYNVISDPKDHEIGFPWMKFHKIGVER